VDRRGRLRIDALEEAIAASKRRRERVVAIIGVAGTTDCGSVDPLDAMAAIAEAEGIHFHVDAAWGAPLLLCDRHRQMLAGIERADTVTIDGHKQFHLPLGTSLVLLRDAHAAQHVEQEAEYMLRRGSHDQGRFTLEGSRAGSALFFHAALHLIGREGFGYLVQTSCGHARQFAELIRASDDFELLLEPETNIVLYRYLPAPWRQPRGRAASDGDAAAINDFNSGLQEAQFRAGRTYVSRTCLRCLPQFGGEPVVALRAVIGNPMTTRADLEAVLDDQRRIAAELDHPSGPLDGERRCSYA
jgi:glutamate decarboxylase